VENWLNKSIKRKEREEILRYRHRRKKKEGLLQVLQGKEGNCSMLKEGGEKKKKCNV